MFTNLIGRADLAEIVRKHRAWLHREADGARANLRGANLRGANLRGANLRDTEIPVVPRLHSRILEAIAAGGRLEMGAWHACETAHCRAGWAVVLAGEAGAELEKRLGPAAAGAFISIASCPALDWRVPNFYESSDAALADITRLAALDPPEER